MNPDKEWQEIDPSIWNDAKQVAENWRDCKRHIDPNIDGTMVGWVGAIYFGKLIGGVEPDRMPRAKGDTFDFMIGDKKHEVRTRLWDGDDVWLFERVDRCYRKPKDMYHLMQMSTDRKRIRYLGYIDHDHLVKCEVRWAKPDLTRVAIRCYVAKVEDLK